VTTPPDLTPAYRLALWLAAERNLADRLAEAACEADSLLSLAIHRGIDGLWKDEAETVDRRLRAALAEYDARRAEQ